MTRSLLPPRGIEMPTALLFDRNLRDAVKLTWLQLRALAWGQTETPPFSAKQFLELTGTKPGTLYEHMRILRDRHALQWRSGTASTFIVSFTAPDNTDFLKIQNSENSEHAITLSNTNTLSNKKRVADSENSELRKSRKSPDVSKPLTAVEVYRRIVERYPKKALCDEIEKRVGCEPINLEFWGKVVTAYYGMGWNPVNIFGMLDYYDRREIPAPKANGNGTKPTKAANAGHQPAGGVTGSGSGTGSPDAARVSARVAAIQRRASERAGQAVPVLPATPDPHPKGI